MSRDYPVQPVPFTAVKIDDAFWKPRIETNRTASIPHAFKMSEETGRMWNFQRAAMAMRGESFDDLRAPGFSFDDTDPYKVIEGASYVLSVQPDAKLEAYLDTLIVQIAAAQEPDGYLFSPRTLNHVNPHRWASTHRWDQETALSHELYNSGHLYEAAAAHHLATGKRNLLQIALRNADLLVKTFGEGRRSIWPGHQITEMGLVKLYRITGNNAYLDLAKFLLDERGPGSLRWANNSYNQSHARVTEQTEAVGHAVRAVYMYAGMADVAAINGDAGYVQAMQTIWNDVAAHKLYLTGGIGSTKHGEAFEGPYVLPNLTAYCETCAAIGNVYWNHRMFLLSGESKYIDVMERSLYNGVISGVSLDGKTFFYPNPLESDGTYARSEWFGCACCPSNITRFLASIPGYVYARRGNEIFVNLYIAGSAKVAMEDGRTMQLMQETIYPWNGTVRIRVDTAGDCSLRLRIPGWARNQVVPSDLYRYIDSPAGAVQIRLNGQPVTGDVTDGYVTIARSWKAGDIVEATFPMTPRRVVAHENVEADRGRVALERGPIVYCAESPDNPGIAVRETALHDKTSIAVESQPDLLGGVTVLKADALTFIPYNTWANRGKSEMAVWLKREA